MNLLYVEMQDGYTHVFELSAIQTTCLVMKNTLTKTMLRELKVYVITEFRYKPCQNLNETQYSKHLNLNMKICIFLFKLPVSNSTNYNVT